MTGIPGLKIVISDQGHGTMSLTNFMNNGFRINDRRFDHFLRQLKSYPAFYWSVIKNRLLFLRSCGIDTENIFCPTLGLTDEIVVIKAFNARYFEGSGFFWKSSASLDAVITDVLDLTFMFLPADCPIVILFDQRRHVLAQVHCGRENILKNIVGKTANVMKKEFFSDASDIVVWISPHLCRDCHVLSFLEFLNNPEYEKIKPAIAETEGGWSFDMRLAIEIQLSHEGIDNLVPSPTVCTLCGEENFFSHRGWSIRHPEHANPGRFAVLAKMTQF